MDTHHTFTFTRSVIIHLLGAPGVGKYTVAKHLAAEVGPALRLVDNHLINNPLFSLLATDGKTRLPEAIWGQVAIIWGAVAHTMAHIAPPHLSFVLTNALLEGDDLAGPHVARFTTVADARDGIYVPVRLLISDVDEHVRRITAPERKVRMKQTDPDSPARYATRGVFVTGLETELTLDATQRTPDEVVQAVLEHVVSLGAGRWGVSGG